MSTPAPTGTDKLRDLMLNESGFAFDPSTGFTYNISPTGVEVIRQLRGGAAPEAILRHLCEEFLVEPARAEHDLHTFLATLAQYGLAKA